MASTKNHRGAWSEPRDLLAERIRRLEKQATTLGEQIQATTKQLLSASATLDQLVTLVGRLSRVVDVQGTTLTSDEGELERRVGVTEHHIDILNRSLAAILLRVEEISGPIDLGRPSFKQKKTRVHALPVAPGPRATKASRARRTTTRRG